MSELKREEFKNIKIEELPKEWAILSLDDVLDFVGSGITPKGGRAVYQLEGIPFIRSQNVYPDGLRLDDIAFISTAIHEKMNRSKVQEHDVLLNITGASIGRCAYIPTGFGEANVNQHVCILRSNEKIHYKYLAHFINSSLGQRQIFSEQAGQTREGLNYQQIRSFSIPVPPMTEQKKIASILSSIDGAISKTETVIEQTEEVKKGLMQQLFIKGIRHTKFRKTEIGERPVEWEVTSLENISEKIFVGIASSTTSSYSNGSDDVIIIRNQNILENKLNLKDTLKITKEFSEANANKKIREGDLLTVRTGYPGITCVAPKELEGMHTFTTLITRLNLQLVNPHFIAYYINSPIGKKIVTGGKAGGAQQNFNVAVMKKFKIAIPSLTEQHRIVSILSTIDSKIDQEKKKLSCIRDIKKGLMQSLFTGKARVKVNEVEVTQV